MPITIFHRESGSTESWLDVNDDGTVTYHTENSGWRMARRGNESSDSNMTPEQAKERWPSCASKIDDALDTLRRDRGC
jgi:hypothetical protein